MPSFNFPFLNLHQKLDSSKGFAIIDFENTVISKTYEQKIIIWNFILYTCELMNLKPIIVGKVANLDRLRTKLNNISIPLDILYFFLHGNNQTCADDAFIIELYNHLTTLGIHSIIFSNDKYRKRLNWSYIPTMISWNDHPNRPRYMNNPKTWIYTPNKSLIVETIILEESKQAIPT
jgi:hypothetical protein